MVSDLATIIEELQHIGPDIWIADGPPVKYLTLTLGTRMTVIRLADGGILLHSPIKFTEALVDAVSALGPVVAIVAPNLLHHLFVGEWAARHPDAKLFAAPGLKEKRPDLPFGSVLGDEPDPLWQGQIDQIAFPADPAFTEIVLFHRASRTAVLTDLIVNEQLDKQTLVGGVWAWAEGALEPKGTTPLLVRMLLKDKEAASRAARRLIACKPEMVVISHGDWFKINGTQELVDRLSWLDL